MNVYFKKIITMSLSIMLLLTIINIPVRNVNAETITFYTHETNEYKQDNTLSLLIYRVNEDNKTVTVTGSYTFNSSGNVDESSCASNISIPEKVTYNSTTYIVTKTYETFLNKPVEAVNLPNTLVELGEYTFCDTRIKEIGITENIERIDEHAIIYNQLLKKLWVSKYNKTFSSTSNVIYTIDGKGLVLTAYLGRKYTVKEGVERIFANAFLNNSYINKDYPISTLREITLPTTIKSLEKDSIPSDLLLLTFKSKNVPTIRCDLTQTDGPLLVVPANSISAYKKVTSNGIKINPDKVTSTLSTKTSQYNKRLNNFVFGNIDWSIAAKPIYEEKMSAKQWNTIKKYYLNISSPYTNEEDRIKAVLIDIINTTYINSDKYYDTIMLPTASPEEWNLYWTFSHLSDGTFYDMIVKLSVAAIRSIGSEAVRIYAIENGDSVPGVNYKILVRLKSKKEIIIDINKEMNFSKGVKNIDVSKKLPDLKFYDVDRKLYDYTCKIFDIYYYAKGIDYPEAVAEYLID